MKYIKNSNEKIAMFNFCPIFNNKCSNWDILEQAIEGLETAKEKGDAFEQLAFSYFLYFRDRYQIEELYMGPDIPEYYRNKLRLEKRDSGVDGLIVTQDGQTIAYQVKFRSSHESPSYEDLTSFWSESEYADTRCIFANCYILPRQSAKKKEQFEVLRDRLTELDNDFFEWLYDFVKSGKCKNTKRLYPRWKHQEKIIDDVLTGFQKSNRGKVLAACGTGKTLTALWIKEDTEAKLTLFIAPNLALVKQTLDSWMSQSKNAFSYICVCSDSTVVDENLQDEYVTDADYIDIPVTTDVGRIKNFLNNSSEKEKIVFSTYQSLDCVSSAIKTTGKKFDIAFFDEAHRTAGNKNSEMFTFGMSDEKIPCSKRLFMTATERLISPRIKKFAQEKNLDVFSMDDKEKYGETFSTLTFRQAIERGIISDYKIVLSCIDEAEIKDKIRKHEIIEANDYETDADTLFKQLLLGKSIKELGTKKIISYHQNIKRAKAFIGSGKKNSFQSILEEVFNHNLDKVTITHVNGTMSAGARKQIFDEFTKSNLGLITNARCLTEGVDAPIIDAVFFADPKNSLIDIIQAIGRSLRKDKNNPNKVSYIIIPIIIPEDATNLSEINPDCFDTLHAVLQAMREQDDMLADSIDKINMAAAKTRRIGGGNAEIPQLIVNLPDRINTNEFYNSLELRIAEVNKNPENVERKFAISTDRTSGVRRTFRTIGDYNIEAYYMNATLPTLQKFKNIESGEERKNIEIDHNNISHTVKIGAIEQKSDNKFYITEIGRNLLSSNDYEKIFREQMLKYADFGDKENIKRFPYRMAMRVLSELSYITRFEFLYSMYVAQRFDSEGERQIVERVNYLRNTYPNIDVLGEANKRNVISELNNLFGTTLTYEDIWTTRTTAYNQFNYFKKHLMIWHDIFDNSTNKNEIRILDGALEKIQSELNSTKIIEICPESERAKLYKKIITK